MYDLVIQNEKSPLAIDVGTQIPHGAVRAYAMGDRGSAFLEGEPTGELGGRLIRGIKAAPSPA